jgi:hypothetical protein
MRQFNTQNQKSRRSDFTMKRYLAGLIAVILAVTLLYTGSAMADYKTKDGYTVHWAGGNNIVVTDKKGNTVYEGSGQRTSDGKRLMWDGTSNTKEDGKKKKVSDSVKESDFKNPGYEDRTIGLGGATGGAGKTDSSGTKQSSSLSSPYEGTKYANMQPIYVKTSNGNVVGGYANVYSKDSKGYSAVPVTSDIGKELLKAGFQVKDGMVLVHNGSSNADVQWVGTSLTGTNPSAVSSIVKDPNIAGGGVILITVNDNGGSSHRRDSDSNSSGGSSGGGGRVVYDIRALNGYADTSVIKAGGKLSVTAIVTGTTDKVNVKPDWGGIVTLTSQNGYTFKGALDVPVDLKSGNYNIVFSASISQPPDYTAKDFTAATKVKVVEKDERSLEGAPDTPIIKVGKALPLTAKVQGTAAQVNAATMWGGTAVLTKQSDGFYRGIMMVPVNTAPGLYQITFEAMISQPPDYPEARYEAKGMVKVAALDEQMPNEGTQNNEDEYDWWNPPWLQGR